jgi:hypothetical protein
MLRTLAAALAVFSAVTFYPTGVIGSSLENVLSNQANMTTFRELTKVGQELGNGMVMVELIELTRVEIPRYLWETSQGQHRARSQRLRLPEIRTRLGHVG